MISRRALCKSVGVSGILAALSGIGHGETAESAPCCDHRARIDLGGRWDRTIGGMPYDKIEVPSSLPPFGCYELQRRVSIPPLSPGRRAILCLQGITYRAHIAVNGARVGVMGPYTPYEFDVTDRIKVGINEIAVQIFDLQPEPDGAGKDEIELGINLGWEAYGGIFRDIFIEIRPDTYIENVRLAYELSPSSTVAKCKATTFLSAAGAGTANLHLRVFDGDNEVAGAKQAVGLASGENQSDLVFEVEPLSLWSPDHPHLYTVRVDMEHDLADGRIEDQYEFRTGFRKLEARGPNFYLNGSRFKLHGLSWLGTWRDQGFTLTRAQMASDMRAMKEMGCNFVRLHLFPQDRHMVELADELGLFICEEPGFWQVDFASIRPSVAELGLDVLARTIRRDWNSPSVFAWLLSNESDNTVEFLKKGRAMCLGIDPIRRFVSAANYRPAEKAKKLFDEAGLDFYSDHPYSFDPHRFDDLCLRYGSDKPLVFDEWGGRAVGQSDFILPQQCDRILTLMNRDQLAGEVFFSWNDFPQFARIDAEMADGIVESGVVTETRQRRNEEYSQLTQLFRGEYQRPDLYPAPAPPSLIPLRHVPWTSGAKMEPIDLQTIADSPAMKRSWAALEQQLFQFWDGDWMNKGQRDRIGGRFEFWKSTTIEILAAPFCCPVEGSHVRPLLVTREVPEIEIPIHRKCRRLHILGQTTLPAGYPIVGTPNAVVSEYRVKYANGKTESFPLRNGVEICTANLIHHATRIAPEPTLAQRAIVYVKDVARERYQVLLYSIDLDNSVAESIKLALLDRQFPQLLFAITAEIG